MLESIGALVLFFLFVYIIGNYYFGLNHKVKRFLFNRMSLSEKVAFIIKTDLSSKYARCKFYINNDYTHGYTQTEWQEYCQKRVDNTLDKASQEYMEAVAPIANAIVLDSEGYYMRRGMENLERSLQRFLPGVNDRISLNYFVEPYEYYENKELAAKTLAAEELRQKRDREEYERTRPMREAREAERAAERQRIAQETHARWEERAARMDRQREERQAAQAARARCSQCVNSAKCNMHAKSTPGSCGGYMPR